MFDAFQMQEQLAGVAIGTAAVLTAVITENGTESSLMLFKKRQYIFVEDMHCGYRQLGGIQLPQA
jgi:hypothetical protein